MSVNSVIAPTVYTIVLLTQSTCVLVSTQPHKVVS
jgi:hypothetical protein